MKKYTVYIHKNKINNKVYVGQTSKPVWARWGKLGQQYCYKKSKFSHAIQKYGFDNFEHIIIEENLSKIEANVLECRLIEQYDSFKNGYNSTKGGDGGGMINKKHKTENIKKMIHIGAKNGMYGKTHSDKAKQKISETHSKPILQYDLNMNLINEYKSSKEIKDLLGFDNSFIIRCCKNKCNTAYGYIWKYKNSTYND